MLLQRFKSSKTFLLLIANALLKTNQKELKPLLVTSERALNRSYENFRNSSNRLIERVKVAAAVSLWNNPPDLWDTQLLSLKRFRRNCSVIIILGGRSRGQFSIRIRPTERSNRSARAASVCESTRWRRRQQQQQQEDDAFTLRKSVCVREQLIVLCRRKRTSQTSLYEKFSGKSPTERCGARVNYMWAYALPSGVFAVALFTWRTREIFG